MGLHYNNIDFINVKKTGNCSLHLNSVTFPRTGINLTTNKRWSGPIIDIELSKWSNGPHRDYNTAESIENNEIPNAPDPEINFNGPTEDVVGKVNRFWTLKVPIMCWYSRVYRIVEKGKCDV